MSGDYSAERFNPRMHLSGLLQQQGRVHYDGDANQLMRILGRRARAQTADAVGRVAVPRETLDGFKIQVVGGKLTIGRGRIYVDGLLAENHGAGTEEFDRVLEESRGGFGIEYEKQPYWPGAAAAPADGGPHLVYLVVYEREATHLELPDLVEPAIGQDTVAALQTVWQVGVLDGVEDGTTCATPDAQIRKWNDLIQPSAGRLTTGGVEVADDPNPCVLSAKGGFRGLQNQLYRIEIHTPGPLGTATFKWSRDNGTIATNVTAINGAVLNVVSTGRDEVLRFKPGDTVEITDDIREFGGKAGDIRRVKSVSDTLQTIELDAAPSADLLGPVVALEPGRHTRIRRWDSDGLVTVPATAGETVVLEQGVQATFSVVPGGGGFHTFDYWTFAARTANAWVEPLKEAPPRGIHRHYARLAVVTFPNTVLDCRTIWPPLPSTAPDGAAPGIHVKEVADSAGQRLLNDSSVDVRSIARGIRIRADGVIDPDSIDKKPICTVTIDLPFPFSQQDMELWERPVIGFSPIILNARLSLEENDIVWTPERDTAEWLVGRLFQRMRDLGRGEEVLAHLVLQGNFVWARERRDDRQVYLDGDTFGRPRDGRTDVIFATGEGTRGGDLRMWFRLIPDQG